MKTEKIVPVTFFVYTFPGKTVAGAARDEEREPLLEPNPTLAIQPEPPKKVLPVTFATETIYKNLCSQVGEIFQLVQNWDSAFGKIAIETVDQLLSQMKNQKEELLRKCLEPYADSSNYFFAHCVNVAILSCALEMDEPGNYTPAAYEKLQQIGLAAALHDVGIAGKLKLIAEKRTFDEKEREIVSLHRKSSAWILKNLEKEKQLHQNVSKILLATHDLMVFADFYDLQKGDWKKLSALNETDPFILEMAALIAFVEVFEALIHSRPHRKAYSLSEAIEILRKNVKKNPLLQKIWEKAIQKLPLSITYPWGISYPLPEPATAKG